MKMKPMSLHAQDFLCALLFVSDPDFPEDETRTFQGGSFHEFSESFVAAAQCFLEGFEKYLESLGFDCDRHRTGLSQITGENWQEEYCVDTG